MFSNLEPVCLKFYLLHSINSEFVSPYTRGSLNLLILKVGLILRLNQLVLYWSKSCNYLCMWTTFFFLILKNGSFKALHLPTCKHSFWLHVYISGSSAGKESTCNAGDPSSTPGSERSPGEGIGYPLQYSWASLVAQTVKNLHAKWETWVKSLGWEDLLEEGMATHSSILAWRIPTDRGARQATVHGVTKSQTWLNN